MKLASLAIATCTLSCTLPATADSDLLLSIKLQKRLLPAPAASEPIQNVDGIAIRRANNGNGDYACPSMTGRNGSLSCKYKCNVDDHLERILVVAPTKDHAHQLTGLVVPDNWPVDLHDCKLVSNKPIVLEYTNYKLRWTLLMKQNPELAVALDQTEPSQSGTAFASVGFKPFTAVSPSLLRLAYDNPQHRVALRSMSAFLQAAANDAGSGQAGAKAGDPTIWSAYAVGLKSVALQADAKDAVGQNANKLIPVTTSATEYLANIQAAQRKMTGESKLSPKELEFTVKLQEAKVQGLSPKP